VALTEEIANHPDVMLIGLGARDSLRLEAGMCLYGHDLNETVSPVEAGLSWLIGASLSTTIYPAHARVGKDRRSADSPNPFPGQSRILEELSKGPKRRRVGLEITESPAREGCKIFDSTGSLEIGQSRPFSNCQC